MGRQRFVIYCHTNRVNGKKYVGQTVQTMQARWHQHRAYALQGKTFCSAFYNAIRKHGPDAFEHEVLGAAFTQARANAVERKWIRELGSRAPDGYNIEIGGGFYERHPATIVKMRTAMTDPGLRKKIDAKISAAWTVERRRRQSERTRASNATNAAGLRAASRQWHASLTASQRKKRSDASKRIRKLQLACTTYEQRRASALNGIKKQTAAQLRARALKGWANRSTRCDRAA